MKWLRKLVDIREGEYAQTLALVIYIFLIITTLTIIKSVRQALFLQSFGAEQLPYVYLLIAGVAGTIATLYQRFSRNAAVQRLMIVTMIVVISNLILFWLLIPLQWEPLTYILYVWVAIYGILTTVQLWTFGNYLYDPRQAKRLFPILGAGATAGGIAGGYITQAGVNLVGTENLLLIGAGFMAINAVIVYFVSRSQQEVIAEAARARRFKESAAEKTAGGFKLIWESRYLKLIMIIISLSIVISTIVDNQFGFVVAENIPTKDDKTAFFGQFFMLLGWASFLMQFFLTARIIRQFGIGLAMLFLPVSMFLGASAFLILPILVTGLLVKIADGTFRYTIHKASLELLYLPLTVGVKKKTKAFIDMFTDRFSKGIAALLVLLMTTVLSLPYATLSWLLLGLAVIWIGVAMYTRRQYVLAFRDSLMRRRIDEDALITSRPDAATIDALATSLEPGKSANMVKTLDTIIGIKDPHFVKPLVRLAHSDNRDIALKALDRLAEQEDPSIAPQLEDLLSSPDVIIAARTLQLICEVNEDYHAKLNQFLNDADPRVRLAAILAAVRIGQTEVLDAVGGPTLEALLAEAETDKDKLERQREIAGALVELPPGDITRTYVHKLLQADDHTVRNLAIAAAGHTKAREFVDLLIHFLEDRYSRYIARDALAEFGDTAVGTLEDYFRDRTTVPSIRRYLPKVFDRIGTQRSVDILIDALDDPDQEVRFSALRSLGRLRRKHPELHFSTEKIAKRLELEIRKAYRYQWWHLYVDSGEEAALLRKTIKEKSGKTIDRIFRLLAMDHPPDEVYSAFKALFADNARIRANAVEFLDNVLKTPHKARVLNLVEGKPQSAALKEKMAELRESAAGWPEMLQEQSTVDDDWLAACALYTVLATRQENLYSLIRESDSASQKRPLIRETLERLKDLLAQQ